MEERFDFRAQTPSSQLPEPWYFLRSAEPGSQEEDLPGLGIGFGPSGSGKTTILQQFQEIAASAACSEKEVQLSPRTISGICAFVRSAPPSVSVPTSQGWRQSGAGEAIGDCYHDSSKAVRPLIILCL